MSGHYYGFVPNEHVVRPGYGMQQSVNPAWMTRPQQQVMYRNMYQLPVMSPDNNFRWKSNAMTTNQFGVQVRGNYNPYANNSGQPMAYGGQGVGFGPSKRLHEYQQPRMSHPTINDVYRFHGNQNVPNDSYGLLVTANQEEATFGMNHQQQTYRRNVEQQHYVANYGIPNAMQSSPILSPRSCHSVEWSASRGTGSTVAQGGYGMLPPSNNDHLVAHHQSKFRAGVPTLSSPATSPPYSPSPAGLSAALEQQNIDSRSSYRSPMTPLTPDNRNNNNVASSSSWMQQRVDTNVQRPSRASISSPQDSLAFSPTQVSNQPYRFQWQLGTELGSESNTMGLDSASKDVVGCREIIVPFGWQRVTEDHSVRYISPSGVSLTNLEEVRAYLTLDNTCKCGLECPLRPAVAFNFDPEVASRAWSLDLEESKSEKKLTVLCAHKRKILAIAAFQRSALLASKSASDDHQLQQTEDTVLTGPPAKKKRLRKKRSKAAKTAVAVVPLSESTSATAVETNTSPLATERTVTTTTSVDSDLNPPMSSCDRVPSVDPIVNDSMKVEKCETEEELEQQVAAALNAAVARLKAKRQRTPRTSKGRRQSSASVDDSACDVDSVHSESSTNNLTSDSNACGPVTLPSPCDNKDATTVWTEDNKNVMLSCSSSGCLEAVATSNGAQIDDLSKQPSLTEAPNSVAMTTENSSPVTTVHVQRRQSPATMTANNPCHFELSQSQMQYPPNHYQQHCFGGLPSVPYHSTMMQSLYPGLQTQVKGPFDIAPKDCAAMSVPSLGPPLAMVEQMISNLECAQRAMVETVSTAFTANPCRSRRRRKASPDVDSTANTSSPVVAESSDSALGSQAVSSESHSDDIMERGDDNSFITSTPTAAAGSRDRSQLVANVSAVQRSVLTGETLPDSDENPEHLELEDSLVRGEECSKLMVEESCEIKHEADTGNDGSVLTQSLESAKEENEPSGALEDTKMDKFAESSSKVRTEILEDCGTVAEGDLKATVADHGETDVVKEEQLNQLCDDVTENICSSSPPPAAVAVKKQRKRAPRKPRKQQQASALPSEVSDTISNAVVMNEQLQQQQQQLQQAAYCMRANAGPICAAPNMAVFTAVMPQLVAAPWMGGFVHPAAFLSPPLGARPLACIPYEAVSVGGLPVVDCATSPLALGHAQHIARYATHLQQPTAAIVVPSEGQGQSCAVQSTSDSVAAMFVGSAADICTQTDFGEEEEVTENIPEDAGSAVDLSEEESGGEEECPADPFAFEPNANSIADFTNSHEESFKLDSSDDHVFTDHKQSCGKQKRTRSALTATTSARTNASKRHRQRKCGVNKILAESSMTSPDRTRGSAKVKVNDNSGGEGELESDDSGLGTSESNPRDHEEKVIDNVGGNVNDSIVGVVGTTCCVHGDLDSTAEPDANSNSEGEDAGDSLLSHTFGIGDLVWGLMRGYTPWPGMVVPETEVKGTVRADEGKFWVRWFGDHTCSQVEPAKLKTLTEGLDLYHQVSESHRKSRKMNASLEAAIDEAMREMDRQAVAT